MTTVSAWSGKTSIAKKIREHSWHGSLIPPARLPINRCFDGGNDSIENIDVVLKFNEQHPKPPPVDFIIKWNPRREDKEQWLKYAEQHEGKLARLERFELPTNWFEASYSIQLSYRRVVQGA